MSTFIYTLRHRSSQIYIPSVNWFLLVSVLVIMFEFRESHRLAAAYGLAVTGTMTLTGIMMTWIFYLKSQKFKALCSAIVSLTAAMFLLSNTYKIPHGGYWSIVLAGIPFGIIMIYTSGQRRLHRTLRSIPPAKFIQRYNAAYDAQPKI